MAAPTFVNAGTGVVETGGPASTVTSGTGTAGDLLILHVYSDGATHSPSLASHSGVEDLAGNANALSSFPSNPYPVGEPLVGQQFAYIGRATGTGAASVSLSTSGDDMYAIWYRFNGASTATTVTTALEGFTSGWGSGPLSNTVRDAGVTTTGPDRLACQLIAHSDDIALVAFTGETGGDWQIAADFGSATGTDGEIGLQTATIASAGTINGGTYSPSGTIQWGVLGFAILPIDIPRVPFSRPMPQLLAH